MSSPTGRKLHPHRHQLSRASIRYRNWGILGSLFCGASTDQGLGQDLKPTL